MKLEEAMKSATTNWGGTVCKVLFGVTRDTLSGQWHLSTRIVKSNVEKRVISIQDASANHDV